MCPNSGCFFSWNFLSLVGKPYVIMQFCHIRQIFPWLESRWESPYLKFVICKSSFGKKDRRHFSSFHTHLSSFHISSQGFSRQRNFHLSSDTPNFCTCQGRKLPVGYRHNRIVMRATITCTRLAIEQSLALRLATEQSLAIRLANLWSIIHASERESVQQLHTEDSV